MKTINEKVISELQKEQALIEEYIERFYDKCDDNSEPITDGIVNVEKYLNSKYRICWVLKEAYDEDDGTGGGWSLSDLLNAENVYQTLLKTSSRQTWQPATYVTYSILNNFPRYDSMDYIQNIIDVIKENINKLKA